jgi:hypothetical protein
MEERVEGFRSKNYLDFCGRTKEDDMGKVLTKEILEKAFKIMAEPKPMIFSSVCLKCWKNFLSYKQMNIFTDCEQHKNDDDYKMIKPLKDSPRQA